MDDAKKRATNMFVERFKKTDIATARLRHLALNFIEEFERAFGSEEASAMVEAAIDMSDASSVDRSE